MPRWAAVSATGVSPMVAMPSMSAGDEPGVGDRLAGRLRREVEPCDTGLAADTRDPDSRDDRATFDDVAHAAEPYSWAMAEVAPRITPPLDELNRPFWTGGASGELRITRCQSCRRWVFPLSSQCRGLRRLNGLRGNEREGNRLHAHHQRASLQPGRARALQHLDRRAGGAGGTALHDQRGGLPTRGRPHRHARARVVRAARRGVRARVRARSPGEGGPVTRPS